jgi:anti-sigma B factor antagonist
VAASYTIDRIVGAGVARLDLAGEIDLAAKADLHAHVSAALADDTTSAVIVDLAAVTFLDSSGIGALVGCAHLAAGADKALRVVGARGQVADVLDLTGVMAVLDGGADA